MGTLTFVMAAEGDYDEDALLDYEDDENMANDEKKEETEGGGKKGYVGIHTSGFKDFLLKPELQRAIQDCGFEHPSEVQSECTSSARPSLVWVRLPCSCSLHSSSSTHRRVRSVLLCCATLVSSPTRSTTNSLASPSISQTSSARFAMVVSPSARTEPSSRRPLHMLLSALQAESLVL